MNLILAIPTLFVLGTCIGSLANLCIYRLAWQPRSISPWSRPDPSAPPRRPGDRLPIVGWLGLRREAAMHGAGFWIRPLLLELLAGIGFAALYWWEIERLGLLPPDALRPAAPGLAVVLHVQCAAHLLLISLMLVASMIDIDEKTIPDAITVPGTWLGLLLAAVVPYSILHGQAPPPLGPIPPDFWNMQTSGSWPLLRLTSPNPWPGWLQGFPHAWSLVVGLGCWWLWCVALMPRTWYARHGWRRALELSLARLVREVATYWILLMGLIGSVGVAAVWVYGGRNWMGLLSALVGMAAGGGLVWVVRIIGTSILKSEAMGFGDVTLMAMIGAFLGWQTCLMIFFIAPFAALIMGVMQLILLRDHEIRYGPFLSLATVVTVVRWASTWDWAWRMFAIGWLVPLAVAVCMVLMGVMLGAWQLVRNVFR